MSLQRGQAFLQVPGPTNIPDRIRNAMQRQAVDFSGPDFLALSKSVFRDIKTLFRTSKSETFIYASNGHGGWEAAISNVLAPGDLVLLPETGQFARAWADMAQMLGLEVEILEADWRRGPDPEAVEARLREDTEQRIKALLLVHCDTATSVASDLQAFRRALDNANHPALYLVDSIAALGAMDLQQDAWRIDVTVAASQKALMMPPGLAFVAASEKAMAAARANPRPRSYWDWEKRLEVHHYRWHCGTAAEHLIFALREALDMLAEEGLEAAFARHGRLAEAVRRAATRWSAGGALSLNVEEPARRSNSVTTLRLTAPYDPEAVRRYCREEFDVSLGGGLGQMEGHALRIGHMGFLNAPMVLGTLGALEASLKVFGVPLGEGGMAAAVGWLAETAPSPVQPG